uniref:Uncharacterized protein n=1 Tax=Candidatus Kentrum sp. LPFa TaxID=2126335 RepID=A0A450WHZ5_9GAMM|nr:MAG: hypothetical protein BECKLPF1236B_GA0070989_109913 [Candidatus Kentron sp. LPFa]
MELHPQVIGKGSRDVFVALPLEEYEILTEMMEDYEDKSLPIPNDTVGRA